MTQNNKKNSYYYQDKKFGDPWGFLGIIGMGVLEQDLSIAKEADAFLEDVNNWAVHPSLQKIDPDSYMDVREALIELGLPEADCESYYTKEIDMGSITTIIDYIIASIEHKPSLPAGITIVPWQQELLKKTLAVGIFQPERLTL